MTKKTKNRKHSSAKCSLWVYWSKSYTLYISTQYAEECANNTKQHVHAQISKSKKLQKIKETIPMTNKYISGLVLNSSYL